MSVNKVTHEHKVILNFAEENLSKTAIKRQLKQVDVSSIYLPINKNTQHFIYTENDIQVGNYYIHIMLPPTGNMEQTHKLKQFGAFQIQICEVPDRKRNNIKLQKDSRFRDQYWVKKNDDGLRINDLTDVIFHCMRLNRLKCFI